MYCYGGIQASIDTSKHAVLSKRVIISDKSILVRTPHWAETGFELTLTATEAPSHIRQSVTGKMSHAKKVDIYIIYFFIYSFIYLFAHMPVKVGSLYIATSVT